MYERGKVYWNQGSNCAHLLFIDPKLGKTSRQKQNTSQQNQKLHGKTKDLTAKPNTSQQKPNTSRQKQIPTAKPKLFCFCCEVFGFAVRFLVLDQRNVETNAIATNNAFEANTSLLSSLDSQSLSKIVTGGELPSARSSAAMAAVGKKLYVFGGLSRDSGWFNDLYALDTGEH